MKTIIDELSRRFKQQPLSGLAGVGGMTILTAYAAIVLSFGYNVAGFGGVLSGDPCVCEASVSRVAMAAPASLIRSAPSCCSSLVQGAAHRHPAHDQGTDDHGVQEIASRSSIFWMHLAARTLGRPDVPHDHAPDRASERNRVSSCQESQDMLSTHGVTPSNPNGV